jgi:two-component system, NtrC family, sensor histidine kinase HydH
MLAKPAASTLAPSALTARRRIDFGAKLAFEQPTDSERTRAMDTASPFHLTRWFSVLSLVSIALVGILSAVSLSRFMIVQMLHRDGVVTQDFVQGLMRMYDSAAYFATVNGQRDAASEAARMQQFADLRRTFAQIAQMPDVVHTNVYNKDRRIVWSSNPQAVGRKWDEANHELEEALAGELAIESEILEGANYIKPEHSFLKSNLVSFVENYIPIFGSAKTVVGVVEIYKSPRPLFETIRSLNRWIWTTALAGSAFLFLMLLWMVRRADAVIRGQQRRLVASETLAAVGEMASAVAHGIRNPLSSIRSSAELVVDSSDSAKEQAEDIIVEVDRLEGWVKNLLTYAQQGPGQLKRVKLDAAVESAVDGFRREAERLGVAVDVTTQAELPEIVADASLLTQVFNSVIANALEAMPDGGKLSVSTARAPGKDCIDVIIRDTGIGITAERLGGTVEVQSQVGIGTSVKLCIPLH